MVFNLSVKLVTDAASVRAHPSGTLIEYRPPGGAKATKAWLSGMSPGGATSPPPDFPVAGAAPQVEAGGTVEEVDAADDAVVTLDDGDAARVLLLLLEHAATRMPRATMTANGFTRPTIRTRVFDDGSAKVHARQNHRSLTGGPP
jgi:hypothetical protein